MIVQTFAQAMHFIEKGRKRNFQSFKNAPCLKTFDEAFQKEQSSRILWRVGFVGLTLAGGSGTVIGAALGALVLAELQNGMNLIGISANPYFLILGAAIVVSMIANVYLSRLRRAGRT